MDNQDTFLSNIRTALGETPAFERSKVTFPKLFFSPNTKDILQKIRSRTIKEQDSLVEILLDNGKSLNICSHIVTSFAEATAVVIELIRTKEPEFNHTKHVVMHDHPDIAALQLWNRFNREAVTLHTSFSSDRQIKDKTIASFIGITAPTIGVADSATLIQLTEPGRPRSTSLLPSIHIAILRRKNLVATLGEAYALLREKSHLDSFVFISGPSKTADIEAHMVNGAHGPRELHIVVISEPPAEDIFVETPEELEEQASLTTEPDNQLSSDEVETAPVEKE